MTVLEPTPTTAVAYPVQILTAPTSPAIGYPGPQSSTVVQSRTLAFYIVEPVRATDPKLLGGGPPQAPIRIVNLSRNNTVIAEVTINTEGRFAVPLQGVATGDTVAIVFNERVNSPYTREQVQAFSIRVLPSGELVMSSVIVSS